MNEKMEKVRLLLLLNLLYTHTTDTLNSHANKLLENFLAGKLLINFLLFVFCIRSFRHPPIVNVVAAELLLIGFLRGF